MNLVEVFDAKRCMSGMLKIVEALTLGHFNVGLVLGSSLHVRECWQCCLAHGTVTEVQNGCVDQQRTFIQICLW